MAGRRHDAHAAGPQLVVDVEVKAQAGMVAVAGVHFAGGAPRLAERKNCRSQDEGVPSPQADAMASAWCAPMPYCASTPHHAVWPKIKARMPEARLIPAEKNPETIPGFADHQKALSLPGLWRTLTHFMLVPGWLFVPSRREVERV